MKVSGTSKNENFRVPPKEILLNQPFNTCTGAPTVTRRAGFTLIELLVVVAIIAILAAILFPVFGRARENARRSACQSNLKQIGLGMLQYSQDYDEIMPRWGNYTATNLMANLLDPYMKVQNTASTDKQAVWRCPSSQGTDPNNPLGVSNSYGYNYLILGNVTPSTNPFLAAHSTPAPLASLQAPAETVAFAEGVDILRSPYAVSLLLNASNVVARHFNSSEGAYNGNKLYDPKGQTNVLWADGHVKSHSRASITGRTPLSGTGITPNGSGGILCSDNLWGREKPSVWRITGFGCTATSP